MKLKFHSGGHRPQTRHTPYSLQHILLYRIAWSNFKELKPPESEADQSPSIKLQSISLKCVEMSFHAV